MPQTHIQTLPLRSRKEFVARVLTGISRITARRRDRLHLGKLDAHLLRDIGLEPTEARGECEKPFWQS